MKTMLLYRQNGMGASYTLAFISDNETRITRGKKSITVNAPLETMSQAWYNWTVKGQYIQDAFSFLNADEREFLLTGITKEEWDALFEDESTIEDMEDLVDTLLEIKKTRES